MKTRLVPTKTKKELKQSNNLKFESKYLYFEISYLWEEYLAGSLIFNRASLIAQLVKNLPAMQETQFNSRVRKIPWRRDRLPTPVFLSFPCGSAGKESTCNVGDLGLILGLGRSPREGKGYPLQYSGLGVEKSWA